MNTIKVKLNNLYFDPDNLRYDFDFDFIKITNERIKNKSNQLRAYKALKNDINELVKSIISNDFIYNEMIIVKKIDDENYKVIEGNRRLAALKTIEEDYHTDDLKPNLKSIIEEGLKVNEVSDIEYDEDILMGMRHVTGVKTWGGFSKAKLVVKLKDDKGMEFEEITSRLGGRVSDIKKRYFSYKLLNKMVSEGYADDDVSEYFTLFYEALGKPDFRNFLGWDEEKIEFTNTQNAERFYSWITPAYNEEGKELPVIITNPTSLRQVAKVLSEDDVLSLMEEQRDVFVAVSNSSKLRYREIKKHINNILKNVKEISIGDLKYIEDDDLDKLDEIITLVNQLKQFSSKIDNND